MFSKALLSKGFLLGLGVAIIFSLVQYHELVLPEFDTGQCIAPSSGWTGWDIEAPIFKISSLNSLSYNVDSWYPSGWYPESESFYYALVNGSTYRSVECPDAHFDFKTIYR